MAKSKGGGTRSYLRGRIANDVYSIGKDSKGKKQQVVRALAESVENPRTLAQMRGRMIMSTVMQFLSGFSQILDHSFDGVPAGQPSLSEFIRENYKLVAADAANNPASGNTFQFIEYGQKAVPAGLFKISQGAVTVNPSLQVTDASDFGVNFTGFSSGMTLDGLLERHGLSMGDYLTIVYVLADNKAAFVRLRPSTEFGGTTAITQENANNIFSVENPFGVNVKVTYDSGFINVGTATDVKSVGLIVSKKVGSSFEHSTSYLVNKLGGTITPAADVAIETYPLGQERFLNGGEL